MHEAPSSGVMLAAVERELARVEALTGEIEALRRQLAAFTLDSSDLEQAAATGTAIGALQAQLKTLEAERARAGEAAGRKTP